jgi:hypothetical protein
MRTVPSSLPFPSPLLFPSRLPVPAGLPGLSFLVALSVLFGVPRTATAQSDASDSYADPTARALHEAAMAERRRIDESVVSYTAVVRQRIAANLRMPLKDRTLYRSEASHRLWWNRDGENLVQVLAFREQTPVGVDPEEVDFGRFDAAFDPMNDRLFFGMASNDEDMGDPEGDDFWFEHPLYPEYVDAYRFTSGDTITLSLPDGRLVQAVELRVVPKVADVHRMTGALWIEPTSGALVRAVYRLSDTFDAFRDIPDLQEEEDEDLSMIPGMLKPWTAEITMISVDYGLWDFEVWMPRTMRMEGVVAAGILKAPISFDYSYELESVTTEQSLAMEDGGDLPEVRFDTRSEAMAYLNQLAFGEDVPFDTRSTMSSESGRVRLIYPEDRTFLTESPELPPPIWEEAEGFASEAELRERFGELADLPSAPLPEMPRTFRWGIQRPDLIRYNRVEGLSIGARGQIRPHTFVGPLSITVTGRLGSADLEPDVALDVSRETLRRRISAQAYHGLATLEPEARHLGLGNSLMALLFGRDDGDYYRRSGGALEWTPPSTGRRSYRLRGYAEYHRPVDVDTDFALFQFWKDDWAFRPNLQADEGWEYGGLLEITPWWGSDPRLAQGGLSMTLRGATGMTEFVRGSLVGTLVLPMPSELRLAIEAGVGTTAGSPSVQRLWYVGGPRTLRGYAPRAMGGADMVRGKLELARTFSFGAVSLFSDYGWAGDLDTYHVRDGFHSVGAGLSILDGLIRLDAAYGLEAPGEFRIDLYLDGAL